MFTSVTCSNVCWESFSSQLAFAYSHFDWLPSLPTHHYLFHSLAPQLTHNSIHSFALQPQKISYVLEADFKCRLFSVQIFQTADSSINEFIATIYLGVALLASNILTMFLAHKVRPPAAVFPLARACPFSKSAVPLLVSAMDQISIKTPNP